MGTENNDYQAMDAFCSDTSIWKRPSTHSTARTCSEKYAGAMYANGSCLRAANSKDLADYVKTWRVDIKANGKTDIERGREIGQAACAAGGGSGNSDELLQWRQDYCDALYNDGRRLCAEETGVNMCKELQSCKGDTETNPAWADLLRVYGNWRWGRNSSGYNRRTLDKADEDMDHFSRMVCGKEYKPCYQINNPGKESLWKYAKNNGIPCRVLNWVVGDQTKLNALWQQLESCEIEGPGIKIWLDMQELPMDYNNQIKAYHQISDLAVVLGHQVKNARRGCFRTGETQIDGDLMQAFNVMGMGFLNSAYNDPATLALVQGIYNRVCKQNMTFDQFKEEMKKLIKGVDKDNNQQFFWDNDPVGENWNGINQSWVVDADGKVIQKDRLTADQWLHSVYAALKRTLCNGEKWTLDSGVYDKRCWPPLAFWDLEPWAGHMSGGGFDKYFDERAWNSAGDYKKHPDMGDLFNKKALEKPTYAEVVSRWREIMLGPRATTVCGASSMASGECTKEQPLRKWQKIWCKANSIDDKYCKAKSIAKHGCDPINMMNETCQVMGFPAYNRACQQSLYDHKFLSPCDTVLQTMWDDGDTLVDDPCHYHPKPDQGSTDAKKYLILSMLGGGLLLGGLVIYKTVF